LAGRRRDREIRSVCDKEEEDEGLARTGGEAKEISEWERKEREEIELKERLGRHRDRYGRQSDGEQTRAAKMRPGEVEYDAMTPGC
jgi:hypothetical protein